MTPANAAIPDDAAGVYDLLAAQVRRLEPEDLLALRKRYDGEHTRRELAIVDAEIATRRGGFSRPLCNLLADQAAAGDRDAGFLLYGDASSNAGDDAAAADDAADPSDESDAGGSDGRGRITGRKLDQGNGYPGGKGVAGVYHKIIRLMPPHETFVVPFLGKCAITRKKKPALRTIGIDIDPAVIGWWQRHLKRNPIPHMELTRGDALKCLTSVSMLCDAATTLMYLDPEYLRRLCTRGGRYRFSFGADQQHHELLLRCIELDRRGFKLMISGYDDMLYRTRLSGWNVEKFAARLHRGVREECVFFNFEKPKELHDVRYAGEGYRERLRIKRKRDRWVAKFQKMDPLERQVIKTALEEFDAAIVAAAGRVNPGDAAGGGKQSIERSRS